MKKLITKLFVLFVLFFTGALNVNAQTFTFGTGGAVYTTGVGYFQTGVGTYNKSSSSTSTTTISTANGTCDGNASSAQTSSSKFYFKPEINISSIEVRGNGTGNNRIFSAIKTSATQGGTYAVITNGTVVNSMPTSGACGYITIPGISVNSGTWIEVTLSGNVNVTSIVLTPLCTAPSIGTQPATGGQSIGQGATATALTVAATVTGLSYQWYSNATASNSGGTSLAPAGQANSFTPPTATIGTTYYYCVVTGTCGSATSNVSGAITVTAPVPTVSLTSGANPAAATYNVAITPVVYGYVNVANDIDVTAIWYTDNTYTTPTTAPAGLSLDLNATAKTMTLSGTPLSIGTFYYSVVVNETNGNTINGSIVVSPPPAPVITGGTNTNTSIQPGVAPITNIVYTLTNSTNASVIGLPLGLSGSYSAGTYTISGTVDASVTPGSYPFTVTATAMSGYSGSAITAAGTVIVKSATAKQLLYLTLAATPSTNDTRLYPMLNNSTNYIVTVKLAAATAPGASAYSAYDVIVLNESVSSSNVEAVALKGIDKPILNLKNFIYGASKWVWASSPDNGAANNGTVTVVQPLHPIFTTPTNLSVGSSLMLLSGAVTKGIQPTDVTLLGSINVATAPKTASGTGIAIHDVPASVRATNTGNAITSKYIMIPICNDSYATMTDAALTLINNALDYLLNGTQFTAPSLAISGFNVSGADATIDNTANTITAVLPISTDLTTLQPTITLAGTGTSVSPASTVTTNFSNSYYTAVSYTVTDGINSKIYAVKISVQNTGLSENKIAGVSYDGQTIHNDANLQLQVYNTLGSLMISSTKNINMTNFNKGVYIVKNGNESLKISILK